MKIKSSLMAIGAMCFVALIASSPAMAKEHKTVTVKSGDTLTSIAKKHKTTYVRLFNANKKIQNPDLIDVGDKVKIPAKKEKLPNRFASYSATAETNTAAVSTAPVSYSYPQQQYNSYTSSTPVAYTASNSSGNTYYAGQCTWYVKDRRPDLPNMLGNGGQWVANAAARGYSTGSVPRAGAVAEQPGHVAYVERVNSNGTVTVSEMNYVGVGVVSKRTVSASTFQYIY